MELKVDPRIENMRKAREAKRLKQQQKAQAAHNGNGTLLEPSF